MSSYKYNPISSNLDISDTDTATAVGWKFAKFNLRTTNGAGGTIFSIALPELAVMFLEVVFKAKLEGSDEYYVELITYRAYNPAGGNVINMSGATTSLSENFTVNPTRAVATTSTLFVLNVGSGGVLQNVNWEAIIRYHITQFNI